MIEVVRQVSEKCTLRFQFGDDFERFIDAEVSRVWAIAQSVEDQHVEIFQVRPAHVRDAIHISAISEAAELETKGAKLRVHQIERQHPFAEGVKRLAGTD